MLTLSYAGAGSSVCVCVCVCVCVHKPHGIISQTTNIETQI